MRSIWWIFTILLGLSISRVVLSLASTVRLRLQRQLASLYPPAVLWNVFLFLFAIEVWLSAADINLRSGQLTILNLSALTLIPIGILALVELLSYSSDITEKSDDTEIIANQEIQFQRIRVVFFTVLAVVPVMNIAATIYVSNTIVSLDVLLPTLVIIGALIGIRLTSERYQVVLASIMIALMIAFIVLEYEIIGLLPALLTT